jgi:hypothetical protein
VSVGVGSVCAAAVGTVASANASAATRLVKRDQEAGMRYIILQLLADTNVDV